jgi:hypothetical protein
VAKAWLTRQMTRGIHGSSRTLGKN